MCGALAAAACFVSLNLLLVITGTGIVVIYAALSLAVIVGRHKKNTSHAPYRMPLFPLWPAIGLLAMVYVLYANFLDEAIGRPSLWATFAIIVLSTAYYFFVLRRKGQWQLRGPDSKELM